MTRSMASAALGFVGSIVVLAPELGNAETLVQSDVSSRVIVAMTGNHQAVQKLLPDPWILSPAPAGPNKGANIMVLFVDRMLAMDPEGKPLPRSNDRYVGFGIPAKNPKTEKSTIIAVGTLTSNAEAIPGPYQINRSATISRSASSIGTGTEPGVVEETWSVQDAQGGEISLSMKYAQGAPAKGKSEVTITSAVDPAFFRIYRGEQGTDIAKSVSLGIDRLKSYKLQVSVPQFAGIFDGTEQLVSVMIQPWYMRQIILP